METADVALEGSNLSRKGGGTDLDFCLGKYEIHVGRGEGPVQQLAVSAQFAELGTVHVLHVLHSNDECELGNPSQSKLQEDKRRTATSRHLCYVCLLALAASSRLPARHA